MLEVLEKLLDPEFYAQFLQGPFAYLFGMLIPMIEAFIPPLPLAAFVTVNVIAFGFIKGYIFSYIGTVLGSYIVFKLIKRFGSKFMHRYISKHHKAQSLFTWIHKKGPFPIFVMLTFPFTPSIIVAGLAAFAEIRERAYLYALIGGKFFMVLSLSFIGVNIKSFVGQPIKSSIFIILTLGVSVVAKQFLNLYEKHTLRKETMELDHIIEVSKKSMKDKIGNLKNRSKK